MEYVGLGVGVGVAPVAGIAVGRVGGGIALGAGAGIGPVVEGHSIGPTIEGVWIGAVEGVGVGPIEGLHIYLIIEGLCVGIVVEVGAVLAVGPIEGAVVKGAAVGRRERPGIVPVEGRLVSRGGGLVESRGVGRGIRVGVEETGGGLEGVEGASIGPVEGVVIGGVG